MRSLIFLALLGVAFAATKYHGHQVWRLHPTLYQYNIVKLYVEELGLDVWSDYRHETDFYDFAVPSEHIDTLRRTLREAHRIEVSVMIEDLQDAIDEQWEANEAARIGAGGSWSYDVYHSFDEIQKWIQTFATDNNQATAMKVGQSHEERDFYALKISNGKAQKSFVINCGIHAREWVSPASCMLYAQYLVTTTDETVQNVLDDVDFYITPVSNPDGYNYTWADNGERMWRKTRTDFCSSKCFGADPNRNWNSNWGGEGSSKLCCSDTYYGVSVMSEPCVQAQDNFVKSLPNVQAYIDTHSYSQMWMFPYGYTEARADNFITLNTIATDSVAAILAVHGKKYTPGQISEVIYVASGSTSDYFYDQLDIPCTFASELRDTGRYGFVLPASQIEETAEESFQGIMTIATAVKNDKCIRE